MGPPNYSKDSTGASAHSLTRNCLSFASMGVGMLTCKKSGKFSAPLKAEISAIEVESLPTYWTTGFYANLTCTCKIPCRFQEGLQFSQHFLSTRVPVMTQQKQIQLGTMRWRVWSLPLLSKFRIRCCPELQCRSHTQLGCGVAVSVV